MRRSNDAHLAQQLTTVVANLGAIKAPYHLQRKAQRALDKVLERLLHG